MSLASKRLRGDQVKLLAAAIRMAFPDPQELRIWVRTELEETLTDIVREGPVKYMAFELVEWAETDSEYLTKLINGARASERPDLVRVAEEIQKQLAPQFAPIPQAASPDEDPDLSIGLEFCWDRKATTEVFRDMIKRQAKPPCQILGIQAPMEADSPALLSRFAEMCKKIKVQPQPPIMCARIPLSESLNATLSLIKRILGELAKSAEASEDPVIRSQQGFLNRGPDTISQGLADYKLSPATEVAIQPQLAVKLMDYLQEVAKHCTVVILLEGFEKLRNSPSAPWILEDWLISKVRGCTGLVIVITGIDGLSQLKDYQGNGVYYVSQLETMTKEDLFQWAQKLGISDYTKEEAAKHWEGTAKMGDVLKFRNYLEIRSMSMR